MAEEFEDFLKDFFDEAEEHLDTLNQTLLEVEKEISAGSADSEKINTMFRAVHTIKGMAGMVNLDNIHKFSHKFEDLLGALRRGDVKLSSNIMDLLFECVDALKVMIFEAKNQEDLGMDYDSIMKKIDDVLGAVREVKEEKKEEKEEKVHIELDFEWDQERYPFDPRAAEAVKDAISQDKYIYVVEKEVQKDISEEKLEKLPIFDEIAEIGDFITFFPPYEEFKKATTDTIVLKILFSSDKGMDEVKEHLFDPVKVVREKKAVEEAPQKEEAAPEVMVDEEMLKEFITGAEELLEELDLNLLELEKDPENMEVVNAIFRAAHTLKGTAGMFGFENVVELTHKMENLFDEIRNGRLSVTEEVMDTFFKALDKVKLMVENIKAGKGDRDVPIDEDVKAIESIIKGEKVEKPVEKPKEEVKVEAPSEKKAEEKKEAPPPPKAGAPPKQQPPKPKMKVTSETIRVDIEKLDKLLNLVGEFVMDAAMFNQVAIDLKKKYPAEPLVQKLEETCQIFGRHMSEIQEVAMSVRMIPIGHAFNRFPRVVRDLSKAFGKEIDLIISGEETELDKTLVEEIGDPLVHLIRNSIDHGIEPPEEREKLGKPRRGRIWLRAYHEGNNIVIEVEDDGRGIDIEKVRKKAIEKGLISPEAELSEKEIINLIFEPGFSTAERITDISGRGVGMDVVKKNITKLKGTVDIETEKGKGTKVTVRLPLTLAIVQTLLVKVREEIFAIPLSSVIENIRLSEDMIQYIEGRKMINLRGDLLPLVDLERLFRLEEKKERVLYNTNGGVEENSGKKFVVIVGIAEKRLGLIVDSLIMQQEVVIKSLGKLLQHIPGIAGGTIMGDGRISLIVDIGEIVSEARRTR